MQPKIRMSDPYAVEYKAFIEKIFFEPTFEGSMSYAKNSQKLKRLLGDETID